MDDDKIAELAELAKSGRVRGRRAARRLASARTPAAVRELALLAVSPAVSVLDHKVAGIARSAVGGLRDQDLVDAVCDALLATGEPGLVTLIQTEGYEHSRASCRAVVSFMNGDTDRSQSLDPTGDGLVELHEKAGGEARTLVAECARAATSLEWVRAVLRDRPAARFGALTDSEWSAITEILDATEEREFLWRLTFAVSPVRAAQALRLLGDSGWRPDDKDERRAFTELRTLLRNSPAVVDDQWVPADATRLATNGGVRQLVVTPDGSRLCVSTADGVGLWDLASGEPTGTIPREKTDGRHLAVTPDGGLLVTECPYPRPWPSSSNGLQAVANLWELPSGKPAGALTGPAEGINELLVTPNGEYVVAGYRTGAVHLWRLPSGTPAGSLGGTGRTVLTMAARSSDEGVTLASGHAGGNIEVWGLTPNGTIHRRLRFGGLVNTILLPRGGGIVAARPLVKLWDVPDSGLRMRPKTIGYVSGDIAATSDLEVLAGAGAHGVQIWRSPAGTRDLLPDLGNKITKLRVLANDRLLAGFGPFGHGVRLWRLPDGRTEGALLDESRRPVTHVAASADGGTIVTADSDDVVTLWRLWDEGLRTLSHLAPADIDPASVQRLQGGDSEPRAGERAWRDFLGKLLRWRDHPRIAANDGRWDPAAD